MRIIRFRDNDGREHFGEDHGEGRVTRVVDTQGVLGAPGRDRREMFRGRTALVADDDANMRELMATVLTSAGARCATCGDGAEAMTALMSEPFDVVVSDIVMPHHTGYEIFTAAKEQNAKLPVVLVTGFGYDPTHSVVRASQEGVEAVLYKPFSPQQLLDEIDQAIRQSTSRPADALVARDGEVEVTQILAPLAPVNVICVGRNYAVDPSPDGELELFMKPTSAVIGSGEPIRLPAADDLDPQVHAEGELAVVIGSTARDVSEADATRHVLGYTAANDVTARAWQRPGAPAWMRGKGFDTFCPLGPAIVTTDELGAVDDLTIRTSINGTTVRSGSTRGMLRSIASIVSAVSRNITLLPGTVILTGAPPPDASASSDRALAAGDEVVVEIDGIGRLVNRVEPAAAPA